MTPQEAINRIYLHSDTMLEEEAALIIESLRKQIPERPIHVNKNKKFDGNWKKVCPMCRRVLMERTTTERERVFQLTTTYLRTVYVGKR